MTVTAAAAPGIDARDPRRLVDRGAVFAGWVGIGMAIVITIAFELVFAIQTLVFLAALLAGLVIGAYANVRSERRRPWWRVLVNGAYAGAVTGVSLAVLYLAVRLLFVYADTGYRGATQGGQLTCSPGPDCVYQRYIAEGRGDELAAAGATDVTSFEALVLREQLSGALTLVGVTLAGALGGAAARGVASSGAKPDEESSPGEADESKSDESESDESEAAATS